MARIHTMDDDITFERIRHLPKRTNVYSVHRKLSWECQKEIKLFEKDNKVTTMEMNRSQTFMKGRLSELQALRKRMVTKKLGILGRRMSCPSVIVHSKSAVFPSDTEVTEGDLSVRGVGTVSSKSNGSVKFAQTPGTTDNGSGRKVGTPRRAMLLNRSLSSPRKDPDFQTNVTGVPLAAMLRRKTMPDIRGSADAE